MEFDITGFGKNEVVVIVGLLIAIGGVSFGQLKLGEIKTRDVQRKADLHLVSRAIVDYFKDHKELPKASGKGEIAACGSTANNPCTWGGETEMVDAEGVVYLRNMPVDPQAGAGRKYVYTVDAEKGKYRLYAALENARDVEIRKDLTIECGERVQCNWYAGN